MKKLYISIIIVILALISISCTENTTNTIEPQTIDKSLKITFIELGSITCLACKEMEPVLDSIRNKYGSQLNVKFIDVIRNRIEAAPYKIRLMPTQLLFDTLNNEIYRHEGYFAEDSIHMFLQSKGLRLINH